MHLLEDFVDDILKCSFCKTKFTRIIKLIPECDNSICGGCYEKLIDQMMQSSVYNCKQCDRYHVMPSNGLKDSSMLLRMLAFKSDSNSDKHAIFQLILDYIQAKVDQTSSISMEEDVNAYCDSLAKQVMTAVDDAFNHLNKLGNELLEKINDYKYHLLERRNCSANKRFKPSDETEDRLIHDGFAATKQILTTLSLDIEQYRQRLNSEFLKESSNVPLTEINNYKSRLDQLLLQLKYETFDGQMMRFKPNELFCTNIDHLGRMVLDGLFQKHPLPHDTVRPAETNALKNKNGQIRIQSKEQAQDFKPLAKPELRIKNRRNFTGHFLSVRQVLFLPDGDMVSCSDDKKIKVWNPATNNVKFELVGHSEEVLCIAALPAHLLASGSNDHRILIWDLNQRKLVRCLKGHRNAIVCLRVLPNDNLVSCSVDNTIMIWNPYLSNSNLINVIPSQHVDSIIDLAISPRGFLVACSNSETHGDLKEETLSIIRAWSPDGKLAKIFSTDSTIDSTGFLVLRSGRVVVCFLDGRLKIFNFDLDENKKPVVINECHKGGVSTLAESLDGFLFTGGYAEDPTIKIWNTDDGTQIGTIQTGHTNGISSISFSKDGKCFASGSRDKTIKLYGFQLSNSESKNTN